MSLVWSIAKRVVWVVGLAFAMSWVSMKDAEAAPAGWTFCAGYGSTCPISAPAWVTIGAGEGTCSVDTGTCTGSFLGLVQVSGDFTCALGSSGLWEGQGDPAYGEVKACFYQTISGVTPPSGSASGASSTTLVLPDFLNLSAEDGLALSVAILGVWATAFATRQLIRALNVNDGDSD